MRSLRLDWRHEYWRVSYQSIHWISFTEGLYRIIAIMLGRLGMTVRECIQAYRKVAQRAFAPTKYEIPPVSPTGAFSANALEAAIKQTVKEFCVEKECVTRRHQGHSTLETCCHSDMAFHDRSCTKTYVLRLYQWPNSGALLRTS